jgi:hypothetical protein
MYYETLEYVNASGDTVEVALSGVNIVPNGPANASFKITPKSHDAGTCVITWPQPPETTSDILFAIPFKSQCVLWACRTSSTGAANSFSGGTILFQGRRTDNSGSSGPSSVSTAITLSDAWWDLSKITFQEYWVYINGGTLDSPTYGDAYWPDAVLFQPQPGETYSPAPVQNTITTWQQIQDILNYAISQYGVDLQIGSLDGSPEFTDLYTNWYPVQSEKCSNCLKVCLRPHPAVWTEIDYTTTPPTIHFRSRTNLTAATLPYATTIDGVIHLATDIQSLDDLVPDAVRLFYKINGTFNGQPVITFTDDIYPTDAENSLLCMDYSIDITGSAKTETTINFVSYAFDPTDLTLWREKVNGLKQISQGGQIPNDGDTGALQFLDTTINGTLADHPYGIQVTSATDVAIDPETYPYHTSGNIPKWMLTESGGGGLMTEANITAGFNYQLQRQLANGTAVPAPETVPVHMHSLRLRLTNLPTGQYYMSQLLNPGEAIPTGLAQAVYNELSVLQWKLKHEIIQVAANGSTVPALIKPGKNMVNLSGGAVAWETMNAIPENVTIEFFRVLQDGVSCLCAKHTINCGPVNYLSPQYLVELANLFWNRNRAGIDANQRQNGLQSSTQVDLSADGAKENSVPQEPIFSQKQFFGTDATVGTNSNVFTIDATTGTIQVAQAVSSSGANLVNGIITPQYNGTGAPSATTLAATAYYRKYSTYVDTTTATAPVLWMCMTSGSNASSVWAIISGGGTSSSTALFIVTTLSNADYVVGVQLASAIVSGTLTVSLVGGFVNIAKDNRMRATVATELLDGVTVTYSSFTGDNYRIATDSAGNTEFQVAFPRYVAAATLGYSTSSFPLTGSTAAAFLLSQCVLKAAQITGNSIIGTTGPVCLWEEIRTRVWSRQYNQAAEGD